MRRHRMDDLKATLFADAEQLSFDGEGRIILPASLTGHAGIETEAAFVGMSKTFEIWHPARFAEHKIAARERTLAERRTLPGRREDGP
jgi:transcriptional regulator MraZ